ncbi:DUF6310 domain-containing protein [Cystobacter fuscus]|uniref:DUF6310 domain-containing protein n=1 Tax=Cystobacter fuscus TaxID=43 RepID=UPI0037C0F16B
MDRDPRYANLQRAAALPWTDGGRCVVQEASQPWPVLAERCYHALDHERVEFHDTTGRCSVASAGAAAMGLGVCVLAAPEIVVGAVIVAGVVVVGFAIKEALDTYAEKKGRPQVRPVPDARPVPETKPAPQKPSPKKRPKPEPKGPDFFPPLEPPETLERERHRCEPIPVPYHLGGNNLHNKCADRIPNNSFPGGDVLVNGKNFDALQLAMRTLWEVKTNDIEEYNPFVLQVEINKQIEEARRERALAAACGFNFRIGVRSEAHKKALEDAAAELKGLIEVMEWC